MALSSMIIGDALGSGRPFGDLYRSNESGRYQVIWIRFFETHLLTIAKGHRVLFNPNAVLAWTSAQPEADLYDL